MTSGKTEGSAEKPCDLIMKGGITSGIVYPSAVLALRDRGYRFSSIGGTSAGAIAAAATAAAQFGEMAGAAIGADIETQGFTALTALQEELSTPGLMKQLFRPSKKARPAFELLLRLQETSGGFNKVVFALVGLLRRLWMATLGWVVGAFFVLSFMISRFGGGDRRSLWGWITLGAILVVVGFLALSATAALRAWRVFSVHLPANFFGICSGMSDSADEPPALVEWLHEKIQGCAGLPPDEPLTFGQLEQKGIHLSMMTTDLTYAVPVRLPLKPHGPRSVPYMFAVEDFKALFPATVVAWMIENSKLEDPHGTELEIRSLPAEELPVIVATRMSLSFPVLLSAVPLWTLKGNAPVRHWMSDGGITSNFPIHFFDAWLPTKPTFGLNLIPSRRATDPAAQEAASQFEGNPYAYSPPRRRAQIESTVGFLGQILDTMQNWRDLLQSELPGFRDRIQAIELDPDEGGMNLTMPPEVIQRLIRKGSDAGVSLDTTFSWESHVVERFRTLMHLLNREINLGEGSNPGMRIAFQESVRPFLGAPTGREPATPTEEWGPDAVAKTAAFLSSAESWGGYFVRVPSPSPDPSLRVAPKE